ncbi:class I SAM-dependent methyltransferase [Thiocapsa imhoffii]|nr:class I SAM-dependent methyltransferase [Thiocapsa imhoffii]
MDRYLNGLRRIKHRLVNKLKLLQLYPATSEIKRFQDDIAQADQFLSLFEIAESQLGIGQIKEEIQSLIEHVQSINPGIIVEIGIQNGGNCFLFLRSFESCRLVLGVDRKVRNWEKLVYAGRTGQRFFPIEGDSSSPVVESILRRQLRGKKIDFLFIDGDHSYDGVLRDLTLFFPYVSDGGLIAFHDIVPDYSYRHGRQTTSCSGEVHLLWNKLKTFFEFKEFIADPDQDGYGIGLIRKHGPNLPFLDR